MPTIRTWTNKNKTGEWTDRPMDVRKDVFYGLIWTRSGWVFDGETEGVCSRQKDQRTENEREPAVKSKWGKGLVPGFSELSVRDYGARVWKDDEKREAFCSPLSQCQFRVRISPTPNLKHCLCHRGYPSEFQPNAFLNNSSQIFYFRDRGTWWLNW